MTFTYSHSFIHYFRGLFGTNITTSSQLAYWLGWWSVAPVSQRSWVRIPYRSEFFSGLIFTIAQVVFITAKITFIQIPRSFFSSVNFTFCAQSSRIFLICWILFPSSSNAAGLLVASDKRVSTGSPTFCKKY